MIQSDSNTESPQKIKQAPQLYVHEWLAVALIAGFLLLLTLIVICRRGDTHLFEEKENSKLHYLKPQTIDLYIDGAVAKPGSYQVKIGTLTRDVIAMAEPLPEADLRKIRPTSKARNGQSYTVATRPTITILISGSVKSEGSLTIPKGTRLCELTRYVQFKANADLEKINRKRYLKDNESIFIPEKQP